MSNWPTVKFCKTSETKEVTQFLPKIFDIIRNTEKKLDPIKKVPLSQKKMGFLEKPEHRNFLHPEYIRGTER